MKTGMVLILTLAVCLFAMAEEPPAPEGMVLIPAGTFEMGSEYEDAQDPRFSASEDEQPVHPVHLDAFYMDVYEVTNAQFKAFVDANPEWGKDRIEDRFHKSNPGGEYLTYWRGNNYSPGKANHPVADVSWYAAMAYAEWAGKRLPTEAEWEYAARGGLVGKKFPWGDTVDANYDRYSSTSYDREPVGQYAANGYGLYDMAGNVREWCLDAYDADFYAESYASRNPIAGGMTIQELRENFTTIPNDSDRVIRGIWWLHHPQSVRVSARGAESPASVVAGFRCVRDVAR